jgi:alkylhydroperoxidase family enzyme
MKTLVIAALLATAPVQIAPPGAPMSCMTPAEVEHATLFMIPPVLDGIAERCRASLPAGAYLLNGGVERSKLLAADRNAHWQAARAAIVRMLGEEKAAAVEADTANGLIRDMVKAGGADLVKPEDCMTVDRALALLAPLPPENLAGLVTLAAETAGRKMAEATAAAATAPSKKRGKKAEVAAALPQQPFICPTPTPNAATQ